MKCIARVCIALKCIFIQLHMPIEIKIFVACIVIQALYYLLFFLRLNFVKGFSRLPENLPPVSVVICARNEAKNLQQYLKIVLIQQYPQFEVVVVNDQSTDNTVDVLVEYYRRNKNLKLVNIAPGEQKEFAGKKQALLKGIETATYDTIVVTDADCRPATTHWLAKMVGSYMKETKFVLGYSPFERTSGLLNKVIRYEGFMTALLSFGFAEAGLPYMGVGRNLSYKKSVLDGFQGFKKNPALLTGDDDLLVNEKAQRGNTEVCLDKDAFIYTQPANDLSSWLAQKKRHLRSGIKYRLHHSFLLFLFSVSLFTMYILAVALPVLSDIPIWLWALFCGGLLMRYAVLFRLFKKFVAEDLRWIWPLLDIVYTGYLLIIFFLLLLQPKDKWK